MSVNALLLLTLRTWNPWLDGKPLTEWFSKNLPENYVEREVALTPVTDRACLVIGPRQTGKSTLIWKTLSRINEPVLYCNCEEPMMRDWLSSPALFISDLNEAGIRPASIFFDEVQWLDDAGLFIKGVVDFKYGARVFVTGSSSYHLASRTRESLAGRADRTLLLPFSLFELLNELKRRSGPQAVLPVEELVEKACVFGGYPAVSSSQAPEAALAGLVDSIIIRDASDRFRIKNVPAFRKVLSLAAGQIGNLVNFSEWGSIAGISNDTVADYVNIMEETHVVRLVRPFFGGKRAEITAAPKLFFLDNGIRNTLFGGFQTVHGRGDAGALAENLVFTELAKRLNPLREPISFWRSRGGGEVDFVVERKGRLASVEVKAGDSRGIISRPSRSFIDAYRPERHCIVNQAAYPPVEIGGTKILFIRFADLTEPGWL